MKGYKQGSLCNSNLGGEVEGVHQGSLSVLSQHYGSSSSRRDCIKMEGMKNFEELREVIDRNGEEGA